MFHFPSCSNNFYIILTKILFHFQHYFNDLMLRDSILISIKVMFHFPFRSKEFYLKKIFFTAFNPKSSSQIKQKKQIWLKEMILKEFQVI